MNRRLLGLGLFGLLSTDIFFLVAASLVCDATSNARSGRVGAAEVTGYLLAAGLMAWRLWRYHALIEATELLRYFERIGASVRTYQNQARDQAVAILHPAATVAAMSGLVAALTLVAAYGGMLDRVAASGRHVVLLAAWILATAANAALAGCRCTRRPRRPNIAVVRQVRRQFSGARRPPVSAGPKPEPAEPSPYQAIPDERDMLARLAAADGPRPAKPPRRHPLFVVGGGESDADDDWSSDDSGDTVFMDLDRNRRLPYLAAIKQRAGGPDGNQC